MEETSKDHFAVRKVRENVILIVFNGTGNLHVVSASQSDITQLCYAKQCQPDHQLQGQSSKYSNFLCSRKEVNVSGIVMKFQIFLKKETPNRGTLLSQLVK